MRLSLDPSKATVWIISLTWVLRSFFLGSRDSRSNPIGDSVDIDPIAGSVVFELAIPLQHPIRSGQDFSTNNMRRGTRVLLDFSPRHSVRSSDSISRSCPVKGLFPVKGHHSQVPWKAWSSFETDKTVNNCIRCGTDSGETELALIGPPVINGIYLLIYHTVCQ